MKTASSLTLRSALACAFALAGQLAFAQTLPFPSPVGLWRTIDDRTGADRAQVRIENEGTRLVGRIVRSLNPKDRADAVCEKCPGDRQGKPIIGMAMLTGLTASAGTPRVWDGGEILDPDSGKTYRAQIQLSDDGQTLQVRGFVGISLFGRTQTWTRVQ